MKYFATGGKLLAGSLYAIMLMGGSARVEGNVSPVAEANIFGDAGRHR